VGGECARGAGVAVLRPVGERRVREGPGKGGLVDLAQDDGGDGGRDRPIVAVAEKDGGLQLLAQIA